MGPSNRHLERPAYLHRRRNYSPDASARALPILHLVSQDVSRSNYSLARRSISSSVTLEGAKPEDTGLTLQALESNFPMHLVRRDLEGYLCGDSHLSSLLDMVNSTWLHLEIEDFLCWSCELSAQILRERQTSRQDYDFDIHQKVCITDRTMTTIDEGPILRECTIVQSLRAPCGS